jgi:hypothetical protein
MEKRDNTAGKGLAGFAFLSAKPMISNLYGGFSFRLDARDGGSAPSAKLPNLGVSTPGSASGVHGASERWGRRISALADFTTIADISEIVNVFSPPSESRLTDRR